MDALWQITATGPKEPNKTVAAFLTDDEKKGRKTYRASLVSCDLLMRSLGRPNREQVVSDRPSMLTTLQALDLSNSELLATTLERGAPMFSNDLREKTARRLRRGCTNLPCRGCPLARNGLLRIKFSDRP